MKNTENAKEKKSFFNSLFRRNVSGDVSQPPEQQCVEEPGAEELEAIEAEKARAAEELAQREKDNMIRVQGSTLYKIYEYYHGVPPVEDDDGCYSLVVFTANDELPNDEQRELLIRIDQRLAKEPDCWGGIKAMAQKPFSKARSYYSSGIGATASDIGITVSGSDTTEDSAEEASPAAVDSVCLIMTPDDQLNAFLFALPPLHGGRGFTKVDFSEALSDAEVSYGIIDDKRIDALISAQKYLAIVQVAAGTSPIDGKDGEVIDLFRREVGIKLTERPDGTIDYRDLGWLQTAKAGAVISEIMPPTDSQDGVCVRGTPVSGTPGEEAEPLLGEGVVLSEDGSKVLAEIDGVVLFMNNCFNVEPLLEIETDIDTSVGNLDLAGSMIIKGDVRGGYSVKATGNITVMGRVENAIVEAGGSIQVGNGMNGSGTGTMRAGGDIVCRYIEHGVISAGNKVVSDAIINSDVSAGNTIEVTSGRATAVGGRLMARNRIHAQTIGNYSNSLTTIILGDTLENLAEKQGLMQKRQSLAKELAEKDKDLKYMKQRTVTSASDRKRLNDLNASVKHLKKELAEVDGNLDTIERNQPPKTGCYLRAGKIYPPVELTISGVRTVLRADAFSVRMVVRGGEVVQMPY